MNEWMTQLLTALALPSVGLPTVFAWCVISATLLPLGSEAVVFAYVKLNPEVLWPCLFVATVGNTVGGMVNYWLAYGANQAFATPTKDKHRSRALAWFERMGPKALFFSFLPGIGDPLTAVAGWLKMPWLPCVLWQALGKGLRYVGATALLLWIPDGWWQSAWAMVLAVLPKL